MTRRTLLMSVAVVAVWFAPVVAPSQGGPPPTASRSVVVDSWQSPASETRTQARAGWLESQPVAAGSAVLVGADWGGFSDVQVQVRARDGDGWRAWTPLTMHDDHQPDPSSREAESLRPTASDPVWIGRSDEVQFRVRGGRPDLDVKLVDIAGDLEWTPGRPPPGSASAAAAKPGIATRASWGANESLRDGRIDYADDVRFTVVHHEGGAPRWSSADIAEGCKEADDAIRAIYEYHTKHKGYWDLAYNFVVDPCGGIWEGRAGGIDKAVMGAHAAGFNEASVGVLALGTFTDGNSDPVTTDLVEGIERLVTWKLDHHHVRPTGTTREVSGCSGCSSRYSKGTAVDVPILSAHQITNSTSCPGAVLMGRLFDGAGAHAHPKSSYTSAVAGTGLPKAYDTAPAVWQPREEGDLPEWDVEFTEDVDWSLRIFDEEGELVRSTGGTGESTAERTWDLRDHAGRMVEAGKYAATLTATGPTGDILPVDTELTVATGLSRRYGQDRIETAVAVSEWAFTAADTVVIASAEAYPDALVSSPLAASYQAPVLLTRATDLPDDVAAEIGRLGATHAIVAGGNQAVDDAVVRELETGVGLSVERLFGQDRFGTAAAVAARILERVPSPEVLVALGAHAEETRAFPDALSAGAFGAIEGRPVVLTAPGDLPAASRSALALAEPTAVRIFGGTAAVPDAVARSVQAAVPAATLERFAGSDRFDTARLAAEELLRRRDADTGAATGEAPASAEPTPEEPSPTADEPSPTADEPSPTADEPSPTSASSTEPLDLDLVFASGLNWPDALGAGAAAAATDSLFLLLPRDELEQAGASVDFLDAYAERIGRIEVAGGSAAVGNAVVRSLSPYAGATATTEPISWPSDPQATATSTPSPEPSATD